MPRKNNYFYPEHQMSSGGVLLPRELQAKEIFHLRLQQDVPVCGRDSGHFGGVCPFKTSFEFFGDPNQQCCEMFQAAFCCVTTQLGLK